MLRKMDSKKMSKIISALVVIVMIASMTSMVFGSVTVPTPKADPDVGTLSDTIASVLGIIQMVAIAIAVAMLIILGVKYITASPEGKAEVKKSAVIYIVGAVILFGATAILQIIQTFTANNVKGS